MFGQEEEEQEEEEEEAPPPSKASDKTDGPKTAFDKIDDDRKRKSYICENCIQKRQLTIYKN